MPGLTWSMSEVPRKKPSDSPYRGCSRPSATTVAPCVGGGVEVRGHLVAVLLRDERAHLGRRVRARADLDLREARGDGIDERVRHGTDRDDRGDRHAALAGRAVAGRDGGIGGHVDVGVRQHDHVVLGPAEGLDALAVPRAGLVDVAGDRGRADEAHGRDVRVLEDPVDGDLVAVDDVEDAVRDAGLARAARRGRATPTGPSRTA